MRRSVIISLSAIVALAVAAALYLLVWEPLAGDWAGSGGRKSALLVVRSAAPRSEAVSTLPPGVGIGLHVGIPQLARLDWRSGRGVRAEAQQVIRQNLALAVERQFNVIVVQLIDAGGRVAFFRHPLLAALKLSDGPDLACVVAEQAREHKLVALADVSALYRSPAAARIIADLLASCDYDGVVVRGLTRSQVSDLHELTLRSGKLLVHDSAEAAADGDIVLGAESAVDHSGPALLFAHARALQRPRWLWFRPLSPGQRGLMRNLTLFRSLQAQPEGYVWSAESAEQLRWLFESSRIGDQVSRLARWRQSQGARQVPVANLVLALPEGDRASAAREAFVSGVLPAVVNGAALAGFELHATYGEVLPQAAAYVVLAIGRTPTVSVRFPEFLSELLVQPRPVVLVVDGLSADGRWRRALAKVGLRGGRWPVLTQPLPTARYGDVLIDWHGPSCGADCRTALVPPLAVTGDPVVVADAPAGQTVLAVRAGNKALVNANSLSLQSAWVLNELLAPSLRAAFDGVGVVGARSAFMARGSARLLVNLPLPSGAEIRLVRYDPDGARQPVEIVPYQSPLATALKAHELLIIEPTSRE